MAENPFMNTNRYPRNNHENTEDGVGYKRTQTIEDDPFAYSSTAQPLSEENDPSSSSMPKKRSKKCGKRLFQSCAGCCKRRKGKGKRAKSKTKCVEYIKKKSKKCRTKRSRKRHPAVVTIDYPEDKIEHKEEKIETSRRSKRRRGRKEHIERDSFDEPVSAPATATATTMATATAEPDQQEKLLNQLLGINAQDFTKSCCYLCSKNVLAIAAAISNKADKSNVGIQTSTRFKESVSLDKSCSPMMYVRTVQSSVKVKTRDMGTHYPEKKKTKRLKPKLNFKKLNLVPKVKFPRFPRMRTVACETEKSMGNNNIPQCRARHGAHCAAQNK